MSGVSKEPDLFEVYIECNYAVSVLKDHVDDAKADMKHLEHLLKKKQARLKKIKEQYKKIHGKYPRT